ncbi:MAG: hypothetical protein MJ096_03180 [Clostridia bacterium]|nr:hypothetical protein [Clostridia bacterium]
MTGKAFKIAHSELVLEVQCIEHDLRMIYAALKPGDFDENVDLLEKASMGRILIELKKADASDGVPDLSDEDYETLDSIREMRNYWCHQCFIDYVYIKNARDRKLKFQEIAERLRADETRTFNLQKRIEKIRLTKVREAKK